MSVKSNTAVILKQARLKILHPYLFAVYIWLFFVPVLICIYCCETNVRMNTYL